MKRKSHLVSLPTIVCVTLFAVAALFVSSGVADADESRQPETTMKPAAESLQLFTRAREKTDAGDFRPVYKTIGIDPAKTVIVVCGMREATCNQAAAKRMAELAPRLNEVLDDARKRGMLIIHSPGSDVCKLLEQKTIENVILAGVHANKNMLEAPCGIRRLTRLGKRVFLMRDMIDSLDDHECESDVDHFRCLEMVIEDLEKHWCPTFTSTSLMDRPAFHFQADKRPHVVFIVSDDHYHGDKTVPPFAQMMREKYDCRCTVLHGQHQPQIPDAAEIDGADCVVLFVRRLVLPKEQLGHLRCYLKSGRPLVGLRTANHAFASRSVYPPGYKTPVGKDEWPQFDAEVFGGSYHAHGPESGTDVAIVEAAADHPILAGLEPSRWHSPGPLYYTAPISEDATLLMTGSVMLKSKDAKSESIRTEPLTWTRTYHGGRIVYTGLGHWDDFDIPQFRKLVVNAIFWAMDRPLPACRPR